MWVSVGDMCVGLQILCWLCIYGSCYMLLQIWYTFDRCSRILYTLLVFWPGCGYASILVWMLLYGKMCLHNVSYRTCKKSWWNSLLGRVSFVLPSHATYDIMVRECLLSKCLKTLGSASSIWTARLFTSFELSCDPFVELSHPGGVLRSIIVNLDILFSTCFVCLSLLALGSYCKAINHDQTYFF